MPGCSCWPVMAVVPLSRIRTTWPVGGRVVDHLDQAGDPAVDEGGVADDADHAPRLLLRQHVAQAQSDADARPHADAGVHGRERRQDAQRVAADVAGDDAVQVAQDLEDAAVRSSPGRAPGGLPLGGDRLRGLRRRPGCGARARRSARRSGTSRACPRPGCRRRAGRRAGTGRLPRGPPALARRRRSARMVSRGSG